jgi:hypothetical protein
MSKTNEILETPAKQSLLFFLKQILDDEHQEYMKYWANFNNDKKSSSISSLSVDHHRYQILNETNKIYRQTPKTPPRLKKMKEFTSVPAMYMPEENFKPSNENDLIKHFTRQVILKL